jgi:hypothetical protein
MTVRQVRSSNGHSADDSEAAVEEHVRDEPGPRRHIASRVIPAVLLMAVGIVILQRLNRGLEI